MTKQYKPSEQHESLFSLAYGKYDDMRMPWVGRAGGFPRVYAITDVTQLVLPTDENRVWSTLENIGTNPISLNFGENGVVDSSCVLYPRGSLTLDRFHPWASWMSAICDTGLTSTLVVNDVSQLTESGRGE